MIQHFCLDLHESCQAHRNASSSLEREHPDLQIQTINVFLEKGKGWNKPVLWIRIRDPVPFVPWIRDPGWVKNQESGSGMNNPDHISEKPFFGG